MPYDSSMKSVSILNLYNGGKGTKHNLIYPNEATSYLTINGKSLPKYISK